MKRFVLARRAKQDVSDIWDYIADDNIETADRVLDALDSAIIKLAKNPGIAIDAKNWPARNETLTPDLCAWGERV